MSTQNPPLTAAQHAAYRRLALTILRLDVLSMTVELTSTRIRETERLRAA